MSSESPRQTTEDQSKKARASGIRRTFNSISTRVGPAWAAALSLIPGLGQLLLGEFKRALLIWVPLFAVLIALLGFAVFDRSALLNFVGPAGLTSLFLLIVVIVLYWLWQMVDAYRLALRRRPASGALGKWLSLGALVVLLFGPSYVGYNVGSTILLGKQTEECSMNSNGPCHVADLKSGEAIPSFDAGPSDETDPPTDTPNPSDTPGPTDTPIATDTLVPDANYKLPPPCTGEASTWQGQGCTMYLVLIGGDAGIGRGGNGPGKPINLRTDTMILLQVDLAHGRAAMYGIPRNLVNVPLGQTDYNAYPYHFFPAISTYGATGLGCGGKTQSACILDFLWYDAAFVHPSKYPYSGNYFARATKAVAESIGALMGVPVNGAVVVDLAGFVDLIDALVPHGLQISNPYEVKQDSRFAYTDSLNRRYYGLDFKKGSLTLHGEMALAFARLRHTTTKGSDYYRMGRQQLVLTSLLSQISPCQAAGNLTNILNAVQGTFWTDIDASNAPALAAIASKIKTKNIRSYTLTPLNGFSGNVIPNLGDDSVLNKYRTRLQTGLNGLTSAYGGGSSSGGGGFHC